MANSKSAGKRARQARSRTLRNRSVLSRLRSLGKRHAGSGGKSEELGTLISALDKAAKRGVIHKNAARRRKARLLKAAKAKTAPAA